MSLPTKFKIMRRRREVRERLEAQAKREAFEWPHAEENAFLRPDSLLVYNELREIDMDAIHTKRKPDRVRRWWWPLGKGAAQ